MKVVDLLSYAAAAEVERERTRELARIGSNLDQIARWANTYKENAEAMEVIAHLIAIEQALDTWAVRGAWLRSVVVGVCLFLGILVGSWGLTRWYSNHLQDLIETKAAFQVEIEEQRQTVERLKETTWGVVLHEEEEGRKFVVLPAGSLPNPPLLTITENRAFLNTRRL